MGHRAWLLFYVIVQSHYSVCIANAFEHEHTLVYVDTKRYSVTALKLLMYALYCRDTFFEYFKKSFLTVLFPPWYHRSVCLNNRTLSCSLSSRVRIVEEERYSPIHLADRVTGSGPVATIALTHQQSCEIKKMVKMAQTIHSASKMFKQ